MKYIFILPTILTVLFATIINVPGNYPTIQAGIDASVDGDTVLVHPGIYINPILVNGKNLVIGSLMLTTGDRQYVNQTILQLNNFSDNIIKIQNSQNTTLHGLGFLNSMTANGAISIINSTVNIIYSVVKNNQWNFLEDGGGGIYVNNSNLILTNTLIADNSGEWGGGINANDAQISLRNATLVNNESINSGGGIKASSGVEIYLENSILWGNISGGFHSDDISLYPWGDENTLTSAYSVLGALIANGDPVVLLDGNLIEDPLLLTPSYSLSAISPCIDAGNPDPQFNDPDCTRNDMGAYYFNQLPGCTDLSACNFNPDAAVDDSSCLYYDCNNECGGLAFIDQCGYCVGGATGLESGFADLGCGCDEPAPLIYCDDYDGDGLGTPGTETEYCLWFVPSGWSLNCGDSAPWGEIIISYGDIDPALGTLELQYSSDVSVYGFQIDVTGITLINVSSPILDITLNGSTIIGYSIIGNHMPAGEGLLVVLTFAPYLGGESCLLSGIASGDGYSPLSVTLGPCVMVDSAPLDCAGIINGQAYFDDCGICSGGTTDHNANSDQDECGVCPDNSNSPPEYIYGDGPDCNGDCFGIAENDDCSICSGGNSGHEANSDQDICGVCQDNSNAPEDYSFGDGPDCNGDCFGTAAQDECGICSGGDTGYAENEDDLGCGCFISGPSNYFYDSDQDGLGFGDSELYCFELSELITPETIYTTAPEYWVLNDDDICPNDEFNDADGDSVCGDIDICEGGDDNIDYDLDGNPDYCDSSPWGDVELTYGVIDEVSATVELLYSSNIPIFAYQLVIDGLEIISAESDVLNVFVSDNEVSGFDLFGNFIPIGTGSLLTFTYEASYEVELCIQDMVFIGIDNHQLGVNSTPICIVVPSTPVDCWGTFLGNAFEDDCGICSGGLSGHIANTDIDGCNVCPDGSYGIGGEDFAPEGYVYPNGPDCNGDCFGSAFIDECGECVAGLTGVEENWAKDCNDNCYGTASIDECGVCCDGLTQLECSWYNSPENFGGSYDCNGNCFGEAIINECGCVEGETQLTEYWCYGCMDSEAVNYDPQVIFEDGSCAYLGDWNNDDIINVLDIVGIIDIILYNLSPSDYEHMVCDLNYDGEINVVDIVMIIDFILYGNLNSSTPLTKAELLCTKTEIQISANGPLAGLQLEIDSSIDILPYSHPEGWKIYSSPLRIIMINLDGNPNPVTKLFEYQGEIAINDAIVSGWNASKVTPGITILPDNFYLSSPYPNPFNPVTTIDYSITSDCFVQIMVHDLQGRLIDEIVNEYTPTGFHSVVWDASDQASGIYFVSMTEGSELSTQKILLLK